MSNSGSVMTILYNVHIGLNDSSDCHISILFLDICLWRTLHFFLSNLPYQKTLHDFDQVALKKISKSRSLLHHLCFSWEMKLLLILDLVEMTSGDQKSSVIFDIITSLLCMFELYNVMEREKEREGERERERERF